MAHLGTDFAVGFVGIVFAGDLFAAEFFLGLGGAEEIGGQLGAAYVIEDLLALFQPFPGVDVLGTEPTVEADVAVVLEDGIVAGVDDSGIFRSIGKLAVVGSQLRTDGEVTLLFHLLIAQLLPPRLDGKIGLAVGDDIFRGISVLDDEVAGVARHHHGLRRALCSLADFDHIGDLNEMILYSLAAVETGGAGRFDDGLEISVIRIAKNLGEVPAGPEFITRRVSAADRFKGRDLPTILARVRRAIFAAIRFVAPSSNAISATTDSVAQARLAQIHTERAEINRFAIGEAHGRRIKKSDNRRGCNGSSLQG